MTSHDPRHDPLDEHERDLARVVRALPGGDPPAALDVRILKAAQDAVAARRAPVRRLAWAGSLWGLGTAAAAVLAVGVSWQLLKSMRPAGQAAPGASSQVVPVAESDRLSVDLVERPKQAFDNSPPPAEQNAFRDSDVGAERQRPADLGALGESKAMAEAELALPEPFTDEHVDDAPVSANAPLADASGRDNDFASAPAPAAAPAAPPPPPAAAAAPRDQQAPVVAAQAAGTSTGAAAPERRQDLAKESARAEEGASLDRLEVTGSRLKRENLAPELYEYVKADQRLAPDAWLRRIRARVDGGDAPAARASLVLFREMHPREPVPESLVQLLRE